MQRKKPLYAHCATTRTPSDTGYINAHDLNYIQYIRNTILQEVRTCCDGTTDADDTDENNSLVRAIVDTLETTREPERIWITNWSSEQIDEIQERAGLGQLSESKARDVLKVIRAVGRIFIRGVKEL